MSAPRTIAGIAASLLLVSGMAACSPQSQPTTPAAPPATTAPPAPTEQAATTPAETSTQAGATDADTHNAGAIQALATAADAVNGTPYEIDNEDNDAAWEVDVMVGDRSHEVKVSRDGQNVVKQEEDDDADADDRRRLEGAGLSLAQAIERALQEVPGMLDDAELDDDNDLRVWKVEIDTPENDDIEVLINVANGQVVRVDR